jgi:hypothetical protein
VETVWLPGAEVPASAIDQAAVDAAPNQFEDAQAADQGDNATAVNPMGQAETEPAPKGSTSADPVAKQPPLESLVLSGVTRWVAVASVQDLNQAIVIARVYEQEKSRVVRSQNGWFAVILGPYAASSVSDFRRSYVGPELPSKILLTRGTGYVETVWQASTATAASETADQSPVGAIERLPRDTNAADGQADSAKALKLLRPLAERGYEGAENSLGLAYASGAGVPQDYVLAHMWFNLAGAQGNEDAIRNRDNIAKAMTPDQIAEAQRLAREWRPGPKPAIQE